MCSHLSKFERKREAAITPSGTKHPVIKAFEPGENWAWCFVDEEMLEAIDAFPEESPRRHLDPPAARAP